MSFKEHVLPEVLDQLKRFYINDLFADFNNQETRDKFVDDFYELMFNDDIIDLQKEHGWGSFFIVCDESNNTENMINNNEFHAELLFTSKENKNPTTTKSNVTTRVFINIYADNDVFTIV
jgi:hypothetical protein